MRLFLFTFLGTFVFANAIAGSTGYLDRDRLLFEFDMGIKAPIYSADLTYAGDSFMAFQGQGETQRVFFKDILSSNLLTGTLLPRSKTAIQIVPDEKQKATFVRLKLSNGEAKEFMFAGVAHKTATAALNVNETLLIYHHYLMDNENPFFLIDLRTNAVMLFGKGGAYSSGYQYDFVGDRFVILNLHHTNPLVYDILLRRVMTISGGKIYGADDRIFYSEDHSRLIFVQSNDSYGWQPVAIFNLEEGRVEYQSILPRRPNRYDPRNYRWASANEYEFGTNHLSLIHITKGHQSSSPVVYSKTIPGLNVYNLSASFDGLAVHVLDRGQAGNFLHILDWGQDDHTAYAGITDYSEGLYGFFRLATSDSGVVQLFFDRPVTPDHLRQAIGEMEKRFRTKNIYENFKLDFFRNVAKHIFQIGKSRFGWTEQTADEIIQSSTQLSELKNTLKKAAAEIWPL